MKKFISLLLIFSIIAIVAECVTEVASLTSYEKFEDVRYGEGELNTMDIYLPDRIDKTKENGCILFIHGGSWSSGDKAEETARCISFARLGYICASMDYTLRDVNAPDGYNVGLVLDEIDDALAKIKAFASERGISITSAATSGYSAGAHLSMLYSFSRADTAPLEIKFTANMAGPADIRPDVWGEDAAKTLVEWLLGEKITSEMIKTGEAEKLFTEISPVSYVKHDTPPSIFVYGGRDNVVCSKNGDSLVNAFERYGLDYDYVYLPLSDHSLAQNPIKRLSYFKILAEYCGEYF